MVQLSNLEQTEPHPGHCLSQRVSYKQDLALYATIPVPASPGTRCTLTEQKEKVAAPPPQQETPAYLWHMGRLVEWEKATTHVTNMVWPSISMVFEGIRGYWSPQQEELYLFHLEAHLKRLFYSMKLMRMIPPYSQKELTGFITELLQANAFKGDVYVSPVAYFGGGVPGYLGVTKQLGEVLLTARPATSSLGTDQVAHCCISSWTRIADNVMPPRAKAIANYQNSRLVSTEAAINGYDFGIILNAQGKVAEAAYACIFILRDGVAITPPLSAGILESITRTTVTELLQKMGIPVLERDMDRTELYIADEVFLCGTAAEIRPVPSVDRYVIGDGTPGKVTRQLQEQYHQVVRGEDPRYAHWLTPVYGKR